MTTANYIQLIFSPIPIHEQGLLIAKLEDMGFEGYEQQENRLLAYLTDEVHSAQLDTELQEVIKHWENVQIQVKKIPPQNWNAHWEQSYPVVTVRNFCAIRADFHPIVEGVKHEVVITPKMSFGTGHHATTYMMLSAMEQINFENKTVLDYGCGTAVLAIVAAYLGAIDIVALDNDYWAYENSLENVARNTDPNSFQILEGEWTVLPPQKNYDIILANINRNVILDSMQQMSQRLQKRGILLTSGFLKEDAELIVHQALQFGLVKINQFDRDNWCCLCFQKVEELS